MAEKAWRCWVPSIGGDPEVRCAVVRADTAGKARYRTFLQAGDSWPDLSITEIRVRRAPEYDGMTFRSGIMPEYVELEHRQRTGEVAHA